MYYITFKRSMNTPFAKNPYPDTTYTHLQSHTHSCNRAQSGSWTSPSAPRDSLTVHDSENHNYPTRSAYKSLHSESGRCP